MANDTYTLPNKFNNVIIVIIIFIVLNLPSKFNEMINKTTININAIFLSLNEVLSLQFVLNT